MFLSKTVPSWRQCTMGVYTTANTLSAKIWAAARSARVGRRDENMVRRARRADGQPRTRIWTPRTGASHGVLDWDTTKEPAESKDLQPSPGACTEWMQLMGCGPSGRLIHNLYY